MATDFATQIITPDQLAMMPNDKDFELVDGRLVERKMGNKSNWVATELARLLGNHVRAQSLGWVFTSEAGYRLNPNRPNTVRKPDVSFVMIGRLPDEEPADAYEGLAPDLAVEVISPRDTVRELDEKVEEYLRSGVRLVWVINLDLQTVRVFHPDGTIETLRAADTLSGEDVITGFGCLVSELFKRPVPAQGITNFHVRNASPLPQQAKILRPRPAPRPPRRRGQSHRQGGLHGRSGAAEPGPRQDRAAVRTPTRRSKRSTPARP